MLVARVTASAIFRRALPCTAVRFGHLWRQLNPQQTSWPCSSQLREMGSEMKQPSKMEAKVLTQRMKEAPSATAFISVLEEVLHSASMDDIHVSEAYHSLASWKRSGKLQESYWNNPVLGELNQKLQTMLAKGQVRAWAVVNVLWGLGHLSQVLPDFLQTIPALRAQVPVIAKDMTAQGVSTCLWAAATLKEAAPDVLNMVQALLPRILLVANAMNAQDVSNNLWAVATLAKDVPDVLKIVPALVARVQIIANTMNALDVSTSLSAAAALMEAAPDVDVMKMVPALVDRIPAVAKDMDRQDVSNILWAVATVKDPDAMKTVAKLVAQTPMLAEDMNAATLSNNLWAAASMKQFAPDVIQVVSALWAQIPVVAKDMNAQNASNSLWAVAMLKEDIPDLTEVVAVLAAQILMVVNDMSPLDVSQSLWAAANLKETAPEVLKIVPALLSRATTITSNMTAENISSNLLSLVLFHDSLPEALDSLRLSATSKEAKSLSLQAVTQFTALLPELTEAEWRLAAPRVVWASARLGLRDEVLLSTVADELGARRRYSSLRDWPLCALIWSYGVLDPEQSFERFQTQLRRTLKSRGLLELDVQNSRDGPSEDIQALPNASILVNITDTFLESFFGPGMALHVREFGANTTDVVDDFRVNLHRCFGENADLVKKMWASTMEVFRAQAQKRFDEATPSCPRVGLGKNGMVALIGMQATGKTTTLQHVLWEAENPFFLEVSHDDVHRAIHNELRKSIWKLPWLLDGMRALGEENISEEMLMEMPRTFEKLRELSASADKEAFCNEEMQGWVSAIKKTNGQPFTNVKGLYRKALNEPIDIDDIRAATSDKLATLPGPDPAEAFIKQMVKTNIF
eukprot:s453_g1.t1